MSNVRRYEILLGEIRKFYDMVHDQYNIEFITSDLTLSITLDPSGKIYANFIQVQINGELCQLYLDTSNILHILTPTGVEVAAFGMSQELLNETNGG
jgi:hypothetical protein